MAEGSTLDRALTLGGSGTIGGSAMGLRIIGKAAMGAALCASALGLVACGESTQEKATKQVCAATSEVSAQLEKLKGLSISSSFISEATMSVEAINKSATKIKEAAPNLPTAQKEEVSAANKTLELELATVTAQAVSAAKSSNIEAALKSAEPQIKASLDRLAASYKKAFEALKC